MRYRAEHGEEYSYVVDGHTGVRVGVHHGDMRESAAEAEAKFRNMRAKKEGPGKYEEKGREIGKLVDEKQKQYGDSWGKAAAILRTLYPDGIRPEQYHDVLGVARVIDKLSRIANGNQGEENAWQDIGGYGLLGSMDRRNDG